LDYLLERLGILQNRSYTIDSLKELIEGHNSNLKAAIELSQNKNPTSEETIKAVDSSVRTLTENVKEVNDLYNKNLENQLNAFRAKIEYNSAEQGLVKAEIEGLKAALEDNAKENKSLKDEIHAQKSEITALKDQNWTFKLQMSSVLYTIGPLENKIQRLSDEVRNLKKSTK
jgi:chromosome segregation ATPase